MPRENLEPANPDMALWVETFARGRAAGTAGRDRSSAMQDGKSLVTDGQNKYHAILGNPARRIS